MKKLFWEIIGLAVAMLVLNSDIPTEQYDWLGWFLSISGPLTILLLPTCHNAAAQLRYRYEEITRFQIDRDFARRDLVLSDDLHEYFKERMTRRMMIYHWVPDGPISGVRKRRKEARAMLDDPINETLQSLWR